MSQPILIKKYANRRLYNTATSSYVTLEYLLQMVKENTDFVVQDAKTGEDITRQVLTQIILEEESKGQNLLPLSFLKQLVSFYGDPSQWMLPKYLEHSMSVFAENQEKMREMMSNTMSSTLGNIFPFKGMEEIGKQNMAMFQETMKIFTPPRGAEGDGKNRHDPLGLMQQQLDMLAAQLDALRGKNDKK